MRGNLEITDYNDKNVYEFPSLLWTPLYEQSIFKLIIDDEWKEGIRKSKKKSVSSIFSNRNYVIYKYTIELERIIKVLVTYYSIIIQ